MTREVKVSTYARLERLVSLVDCYEELLARPDLDADLRGTYQYLHLHARTELHRLLDSETFSPIC